MKRKISYTKDYAKKYKKIHYIILSTEDKETNEASMRGGRRIKNNISGSFNNMTYRFNTSIRNVQAFTLVGFELTLNVNQLVAGSGNSNLYHELIKGIDVTIMNSSTNFEQQIHHPRADSNFHIEFKRTKGNPFDEHNELVNANRNLGVMQTSTTTHRRSEQEFIQANQNIFNNNYLTLTNLANMYTWLVSARNSVNYIRNSAFNQDTFDNLIANASFAQPNYEYVSQTLNTDGGRSYISAAGRATTPERISERTSNVGNPAHGATTRSNNLTTFYESEYITSSTASGAVEGTDYSSNRIQPFGRWYRKGSPLAQVNERINNPTFDVAVYTGKPRYQRGGNTNYLNGRYYTNDNENNRVEEFIENELSVSDSIRADIITFLNNSGRGFNTKKFILDVTATTFINHLQAYANREEDGDAIAKLTTSSIQISNDPTTTVTTFTGSGSGTPIASAHIHTLQYFNTSTLTQSACSSSSELNPSLEFVNITLSFPHLNVSTAERLLNRLNELNNNNQANYSLTLGVCIKG